MTRTRNRSNGPRGPRADSAPEPESTRDRILDAAGRQFLEHGYERTTMNRLAEAVGVSAPALYWHFKSKEQVLFAFMENALQELLTFVEAHLTATEPLAQLRQFVGSYVVFQLQNNDQQAAYGALQGYSVGQLSSALQSNERHRLTALQRRFYQRLRDILDDGNRVEVFDVQESSVTALAIITMCDYTFTWFDPAGRLDADAVARHFEQLVERMVARTGPASEATSAPGRAGASGDLQETVTP